MIGFNELGRKGNLGNQMFQYAGLRGIAAYRGFDWRIPPIDETRIHNYDLFRLFKMSSVSPRNIGYVPYRTHRTKWKYWPNSTGFEFDPRIFNSIPDNRNLNGFFQSPKYFSNIEDTIREDFRLQDYYLVKREEKREAIGREFIALHVRRGDYVKLKKHHPPLELEYYLRALSLLDKNLPIMVFTNDKPWVQEQQFFRELGVEVVDNEDYLLDLSLMMAASHIIIANSSFSWWGAWLSNCGSVIAPKKWFGPKLAKNSTKDLYPKDWLLI